jgi:hypothetical protein
MYGRSMLLDAKDGGEEVEGGDAESWRRLARTCHQGAA